MKKITKVSISFTDFIKQAASAYGVVLILELPLRISEPKIIFPLGDVKPHLVTLCDLNNLNHLSFIRSMNKLRIEIQKGAARNVRASDGERYSVQLLHLTSFKR